MGLEERMKYLRHPYKRGQKRPLEDVDMNQPTVPPVKKVHKPVMPAAVVQLQSEPTREDSASNTRNIKMLQTLSKQVCEYACTSKQITVSLK